MELLSAIPFVGGPLSVILPFLFVLGIVVFVHEYGHYIVGRWCGIHSEVFSIGFGPRLFGWSDRRGTRWQVAALPLGGYVRFVGDMDPASAGRVDDSELSPQDRQHAFHNAPLGARAATVFAGPLFNFVLTFVLFFAVALAVGKAVDEPVIGGVEPSLRAELPFEPGDRVIELAGAPVESFGEIVSRLIRSDGGAIPAIIERNGERRELSVRYEKAPIADMVSPGTPSAGAGMLPGDEIVAINGQPIESFYEVQLATAEADPAAEMTIEVLRDGERLSFTLIPDVVSRPHPVTGETVPLATIGVATLGLGGIEPKVEAVGLGEAAASSAARTIGIITGTVSYIGDMIFDDADTSQLGGPIRIAQISGEKAEEGMLAFIYLIAVISTSIGFINLLPIPVLDGGHLMFYAFEAIRGRPVGDAAIRIGTTIGLSLVLLLMAFAMYNDLTQIRL